MMTLKDVINEKPWLLELGSEAVVAFLRGEKARHDDGLSDEMKLTEFYRMWYRPQVSEAKNVSAETMKKREEALGYWVKITGDPALKEIRLEMMNSFVKDMRKQKQSDGKLLAPATILKHCRAIASIINHAGPASSSYPNAQGLIPLPPRFPPIEVVIDIIKKTPNLREAGRIITACRTLKIMHPILPDVTPNQWWESIYTFMLNTGLRAGETMAARWSDITEVNGIVCLVVRSIDTKKHKENPVPLNLHAVAALNMMPRYGANDLIYPFPAAESTLRRTRQKIIAKAGVNPKKGVFHAVRRLVGTVCNDAQLVLGHTTAEMTRVHYQSIERKEKALDAMPQPIFD